MEIQFIDDCGTLTKGVLITAFQDSNRYNPTIVLIVDGKIMSYNSADMHDVKIKKEN